jgi:hypothetical protein
MRRDLTIAWRSGPAKGYTDVLPRVQFERECGRVEAAHRVEGPRKGNRNARYYLSVKGQRAVLDYGPFRKENNAHDILPGIMLIEFSDASRRTAMKVLWSDTQRVPAAKDQVDVTLGLRAPPPFGLLARRGSSRSERDNRLGAVEFRNRVELAYGYRCCITGCSVREALQAAHIVPYTGPASDDPRNGLLIRADLHALLDGNLMAIEPRTRRVHFAGEAMSWGEYRRLHGRARLDLSQAKMYGAAPRAGAFEDRWRAFKANQSKR